MKLLSPSLGLLLAALVMAASTQAPAQEYTFTTIAGPPELGPGDADGPGSLARFYTPKGVAVDSAGNVYVADTGNHTIRKLTPGSVVTTLAGLARRYGSTDGTGSAARFYAPYGVAVDSAGNVYVADTFNSMIRKVTSGGMVTTLAGLARSYGNADGTGSAARFNNPWGVAVDSAGNVYVADSANSTIRKVTPGGVVTTLAGLAGSWGSSADGTGSAARFFDPRGVATDSVGNVYVADSGNATIRKVTSGGVVTTVAGAAGFFPSPPGSGGRAGYVGSADGTGSAARFNRPYGVAVDSAGNVYVANSGNNTIRLGRPACPDAPTIDLVTGPVGQARQLDTSPQTAVAWQWRLVRVPAASAAASWTANVRNPTFTPDVADLFIFRLTATNAAGSIAIRTLAFTAVDFNPQLGISTDATGKVTITWTTGTLVSSPTADGGYAPVANATSPYEITPPSTGSMFYRVKQ